MKNKIVIVIEDGVVDAVFAPKEMEYIVVDKDIHAQDLFHAHSNTSGQVKFLKDDQPEVFKQLKKEKYL